MECFFFLSNKGIYGKKGKKTADAEYAAEGVVDDSIFQPVGGRSYSFYRYDLQPPPTTTKSREPNTMFRRLLSLHQRNVACAAMTTCTEVTAPRSVPSSWRLVGALGGGGEAWTMGTGTGTGMGLQTRKLRTERSAAAAADAEEEKTGGTAATTTRRTTTRRSHMIKRATPTFNLKAWCETNGELGARVLEEWDELENNDGLGGRKRPEDVTRGSAYRAWWKCRVCAHKWSAMVGPRTRRGGVSTVTSHILTFSLLTSHFSLFTFTFAHTRILFNIRSSSEDFNKGAYPNVYTRVRNRS